jgi:hypothetical protein
MALAWRIRPEWPGFQYPPEDRAAMERIGRRPGRGFPIFLAVSTALFGALLVALIVATIPPALDALDLSMAGGLLVFYAVGFADVIVALGALLPLAIAVAALAGGRIAAPELGKADGEAVRRIAPRMLAQLVRLALLALLVGAATTGLAALFGPALVWRLAIAYGVPSVVALALFFGLLLASLGDE